MANYKQGLNILVKMNLDMEMSYLPSTAEDTFLDRPLTMHTVC